MGNEFRIFIEISEGKRAFGRHTWKDRIKIYLTKVKWKLVD
jgi:hypothetical protein